MKGNQKNIGDVYCNSGAWNAFNLKLNKLNPSKVFVLVDANTKSLCLPIFLKNYHFNKKAEILEISEGEINKNIATCLNLWNELSEKGADRNSLLINLGGGVVTDLGGFVASTFKRGINFINIPTTLLSMVDASVGGKNGVDLGMLKNQIGIIKNSEMVIINTEFLKTLPDNQITSGYAEMLKHGLIYSNEYWNNIKAFNELDIDEIEELLWESVLIKNEVITEDPFEKGIRKTLNYGHTLGHAIETYSLSDHNLKPLLHGEAVAIGMILATYISTKLTGFSTDRLDDISSHIINKFSKVSFTSEEIEEIIKLLIYDKKNDNGKILFVLLNDIGNCQLNCEVPNELIFEAFEYYKNYK
ncbi:MAG: 3-dehydroquinate synthase [Flavobacteriaceae bacterium]